MSTSRFAASCAAELGSYPARISSSARQRSTRPASVSMRSSTAGISSSTLSLRDIARAGSPPSGVLTTLAEDSFLPHRSLRMMRRLVGINHIALEVADIEAALAWYGRFFALEVD